MDFKQLKQNPAKVHEALHEVGESLVTSKGCKIYVPCRFEERRLAVIGTETYIVGIFAITVDDTYMAVSMAIANMRIEPTSINTITIEGDDYYEFYFEPGAVVIPDLMLEVEDTLAYYVYDEIIAKGKIPWYLKYLEVGGLFDSAKYHAGLNVGANPAVMEMIVASIARDPDDLAKYYRHTLKGYEDVVARPPAFIPFSNVIYGATNTTARFIGSYFDHGVMAALVNPSTRNEKIEDLLRQ